MGRRNKSVNAEVKCGREYVYLSGRDGAVRDGADPWKRQRKERINHSPYDLPKVDVHAILFAIVAVVFVVYPLMQWALSR